MRDPTEQGALQHAVSLSAGIELQLRHGQGNAPLLALLDRANRASAAAIVRLADVNPEDPAAIRSLQNDIKAFALIVAWLAELVRDGFEAGDFLDLQRREDLADLVGLNEDEADDFGSPQHEG